MIGKSVLPYVRDVRATLGYWYDSLRQIYGSEKPPESTAHVPDGYDGTVETTLPTRRELESRIAYLTSPYTGTTLPAAEIHPPAARRRETIGEVNGTPVILTYRAKRELKDRNIEPQEILDILKTNPKRHPAKEEGTNRVYGSLDGGKRMGVIIREPSDAIIVIAILS